MKMPEIQIKRLVFCPKINEDVDVEDDCQQCEHYNSDTSYELSCSFGEEKEGAEQP